MRDTRLAQGEQTSRSPLKNARDSGITWANPQR